MTPCSSWYLLACSCLYLLSSRLVTLSHTLRLSLSEKLHFFGPPRFAHRRSWQCLRPVNFDSLQSRVPLVSTTAQAEGLRLASVWPFKAVQRIAQTVCLKKAASQQIPPISICCDSLSIGVTAGLGQPQPFNSS